MHLDLQQARTGHKVDVTIRFHLLSPNPLITILATSDVTSPTPLVSPIQPAAVMTDLTPRVVPIAFQVEARARVGWLSQGLGDMRSHGLHVTSPPLTVVRHPPH